MSQTLRKTIKHIMSAQDEKFDNFIMYIFLGLISTLMIVGFAYINITRIYS